MARGTPASTTLIIASYNQPKSLALVLEAVARQTRPVDEIIIADDGSARPTFDVIERLQQQFSLPISAVITQEDRGFRKAVALNRAILRSTGQQLLFLDGDVIPPPRWAEAHMAAYRPMGYGIGSYIRLSLAESNDVTQGGVECIDWPAYMGLARRKWLYIGRNFRAGLYVLLRKPDRPKVWGGNLSVDRGVLYGVNGFDERYCGFSGEDSDLRNRMNNYGARPVNLFYPTLALHLHARFEGAEVRSGANLSRGSTRMSVYQGSKQNLWADEGLTSHIASGPLAG
jgi:glycosyltransferase involved in cell wall biosynthesis